MAFYSKAAARGALSAFMAFQAATSVANDKPDGPPATFVYSWDFQNYKTITTESIFDHTPPMDIQTFVTNTKAPPVSVDLKGPIESSSALILQITLKHIEDTMPGRRINIYIDSPGGEVFWGNHIMASINSAANPIDVICTGQAKSMAAIIFMGHPASKGKRIAQSGCNIMTHAAYLLYEDKTIRKLHDPKLSIDQQERLNDIRDNFAAVLKRGSSLKLRQIYRYVKVQDRHIPLTEALKNQMIDDIHYELPEIAVTPPPDESASLPAFMVQPIGP